MRDMSGLKDPWWVCAQNEAWLFTTRFDVSWSFYHQFGVQTLVFFWIQVPPICSIICIYSLWQFEGNWRQVLHWRNKSMCLVILYGELYRATIWCGHFIATCRCLLPKSSPKAATELPQPTNQISRSSDQELRRFGFGENFTATLSWILRGCKFRERYRRFDWKGGGLIEMPWIVPVCYLKLNYCVRSFLLAMCKSLSLFCWSMQQILKLVWVSWSTCMCFIHRCVVALDLFSVLSLIQWNGPLW